MPRSRHASLRLTLLAALSVIAVASPARAQPAPQVDTSRLDQLEAELGELEQDVHGREGTVEELDSQAQQLRGEEAQAQARLEEIEAELSLVVERYNEAVVALEGVQAERAITADELDEVTDEVGALSAAVAEHARRLHKLGPTVEFATMLAANPTDLGFKGSSLRRILTAEQVALEDLAAARMRLDALEDRLAQQEAEADVAAARVEREVVEVEATYERHEDELAELAAVLARVEAEHVAERAQLDEDRDRLTTQQDAVATERARLAEEQRRLEREQREQQRREQQRREQQRQEQERRDAAAAAAASASTSSGSTSASGGGSGSGGSSTGGSSTGGSSSGGSGGTSSGTRRSAQVAVDTALAQVGKPYRWGAAGPNAFDCSGLTSYSWAAAGVRIPRTSGAQYAGLKKVSRSQLQPGDLVFYHSPISHVAMYVGGDTIVEASRAGIPVRTASLSSRSPVGYARP